jgi:hypothetical protein
MRIRLLWQHYRFFPYEREFAKREVQELLGYKPSEQGDGLAVPVRVGWEQAARRVTYFREIVGDGGERIVPLQAQLEAVTNGETPVFDFAIDMRPVEARQSTRYSAHGLHEYKGKFNPQVVRAICNMLGMQAGGWILDPFCGSGTTLLEAFHLGLNAIGVDLNPLGVEISNAKIAAMQVPSGQLLEHVATVKVHLNERIAGMRFDRPFSDSQLQRLLKTDWQNRLNCPSYLRVWFTESALAQLAAIMEEIESLPSERIQLIMRVVLSDIVRDVSLQDAADLRIRRRKSPPENEPVIPLFLSALSKKVSSILKARQLVQRATTEQVARLGDALRCRDVLKSGNGGGPVKYFDAAITSPPYATALPYIDTQRLSLVLLGLVNANQIRDTERSLVGNREITEKERSELDAALEANHHGLPDECVSICRSLKTALNRQSDGFRRKNVPGLLYKYLTEMAKMFRQVHGVLKKGAPYALIVGRNSTRLGGRVFIIDTPRLLSILAEANGFRLRENMELETYQRFNVHQANSIRTEMLTILERR